MVTQLSDVLAPASLSHAERRVVERLVELLRDELDSDLHAIWLYGSRARGKTPHAESDIDLMVIAEGGDRRYGMKSIELVNEVAARSAPSSSPRSTATRSCSTEAAWSEPALGGVHGPSA
jgi:predicted nucleotidyltransferase